MRKNNLFGSHLKLGVVNKLRSLYERNNINICYNKFIPEQYDEKKSNILLAIESPALIEHEDWIKPYMNFDGEVSFKNFFGLENYVCCRTLYVNNDNFVNIEVGTLFKDKSELVSIVSSNKRFLEGHKLRHSVVKQYGQDLNIFGSGYQKFGNIDAAFTKHKFQIVIENGKYPEYVSEKFFDCIKTQTVPIYWGGEDAVQKMGFDLNGVIFFNSIAELDEIIPELGDGLYFEKYNSLIFNLRRLIELRNENKMNYYLNSFMLNYMHTTKSYLCSEYNNLNLELENYKDF
ncbi:glycosyltransferase family 10 [uncultured Draconibacterium sp.]|uniref:glycosyltransferase family 10 domain-containing protein n=1 Tax=uncultured Draconibacterium sp. TaxID=1573823 RepID=UPI0025F1D8D4|nr:glycosyltransferase family 10 [uncultured Draconibacterium sp.]